MYRYSLTLFSPVLICAALLSTFPAWSAPVVLKGAGDNPPAHTLSRPREHFFKLLEQKGNDQIRIRWIGGREIFPDDQVAMAVATGVIDLGSIPNTAYENLIPEIQVLDGSRLVGALYRETGLYDELEASLNQKGLHLVAVFSGLRFQFLLGKRAKVPATPQEMAGMKIRLPGHYTAFPEALGIRPVRMTPSEMFTALDTGVLDGLLTSTTGAVAAGMYEILGAVIDVPLYVANMTLIMNLKAWNKLPPAQQQLMTDTAIATEEWSVQDYERLGREARKVMQDSGVRFISFTPAQNQELEELAFDSFWKQMNERLPDKGPMLQELAAE